MGSKQVRLNNPYKTAMTAAIYKKEEKHQYKLIHVEWVGPRSTKKFWVINKPLKMHIYNCTVDQHEIPSTRTFKHKKSIDEMIDDNVELGHNHSDLDYRRHDHDYRHDYRRNRPPKKIYDGGHLD